MSLQQVLAATTNKVQYVQNAPQLIDAIKGGDLQTIQILLELTEKSLKDENEPILKKFLLIRLIKDCVVIKSGKLINALASSKSLLSAFETICSFEPGNSDPNRGKNLYKNQDQNVCAQFMRLCLELVNFVGTSFPFDQKKNPTKFKILLDSLLKKNVIFPEQSEMMQALKKSASINKQQDSSENQNQFQSQSSLVQVSQQQKDETMKKLNEIRKSVMDDMEMINDTLREGVNADEMEYVHDVLDTFSKSLQQVSKDFRKQLELIQQFPNTLEQRDLNELYNLLEFSDKYPALHSQFVQQKQTQAAFNQLKQKVQLLSQKVVNYEDQSITPQPPQDSQPIKQEQTIKQQIGEDEKQTSLSSGQLQQFQSTKTQQQYQQNQQMTPQPPQVQVQQQKHSSYFTGDDLYDEQYDNQQSDQEFKQKDDSLKQKSIMQKQQNSKEQSALHNNRLTGNFNQNIQTIQLQNKQPSSGFGELDSFGGRIQGIESKHIQQNQQFDQNFDGISI